MRAFFRFQQSGHAAPHAAKKGRLTPLTLRVNANVGGITDPINGSSYLMNVKTAKASPSGFWFGAISLG
jgi:hypothetical protein